MENKVVLFNEKELIVKIRNGDTMAFNQIYRHYAKRLTIRLLHLLKSEELAQDVLQDVFLKVWEVRDRLDPELAFGSFLYTIAGNLGKNTFRRALQFQIYQNEMPFEETYSPIEQQWDQKDTEAILEMALNQLTPRQKEVYTLHKIEGYSYKEISDRLNISPNTINQLMQQANKHLKNILAPYSLLLVSILLH